jgi:RNA recognition motif-containing protein
MMNIHVGNLSLETTEEDLMKIFSRFGKVKSVRIIKYPSSASKGYGFIDMPASAEAMEAIQKMKAKDVNGKIISVGEARSRN